MVDWPCLCLGMTARATGGLLRGTACTLAFSIILGMRRLEHSGSLRRPVHFPFSPSSSAAMGQQISCYSAAVTSPAAADSVLADALACELFSRSDAGFWQGAGQRAVNLVFQATDMSFEHALSVGCCYHQPVTQQQLLNGFSICSHITGQQHRPCEHAHPSMGGCFLLAASCIQWAS